MMTSMMTRIVTGLILAPVVVALTLWSPVWLFAVVTLAVMLAALLEWSHLGQVSIAVPVGIAVVLIIAALLLFHAPQKLPVICLAGLLFWAYQAFTLIAKKTDQAPIQSQAQSQAQPPTQPTALHSMVQGGFIFLFAWAALLLMRLEHGAVMTVAMLVVIWSADTFAYFIGKRFGRRKLAPSISPGKTMEGLVGGLVGAGLVAMLAATWLLNLNTAQTLGWLLASLVAALFGVFGDLYESRLKRHAGVKDSGRLLPGHGGLLDRIDGLLAATPAYVTIWATAGRLSG